MLWQLFDHSTENAKRTTDTYKRPQQLEACTITLGEGQRGERMEKVIQAQQQAQRNHIHDLLEVWARLPNNIM